MNSPQTIKNQYDVVLSHYKNNIKDEQIAIFYVVCTQITKTVAVDLLKKFRKEPVVVLKTYDSLAQARSFAEALMAVGAQVNIQTHSVESSSTTVCAFTKKTNNHLFNQHVIYFQLSVGIAVLFISFVTKSALLAMFSLFFIIFMLIELKKAKSHL